MRRLVLHDVRDGVGEVGVRVDLFLHLLLVLLVLLEQDGVVGAEELVKVGLGLALMMMGHSCRRGG